MKPMVAIIRPIPRAEVKITFEAKLLIAKLKDSPKQEFAAFVGDATYLVAQELLAAGFIEVINNVGDLIFFKLKDNGTAD
jgi:hypothetical protein